MYVYKGSYADKYAKETGYNVVYRRADGKLADLEQEITVPETKITKVYGNKAFTLDAFAKTALKYKTSDKSVVTVNSKGKVTIKGTGKAKITITAPGNDIFRDAKKKTVTITVNPKGTALKSVTAAKKGFTVKWNKPASKHLKKIGNKKYVSIWSKKKSVKTK